MYLRTVKKSIIFAVFVSLIFSVAHSLNPSDKAEAIGTLMSCTPSGNAQPSFSDPDFPSPVPQFFDPDQSSSADGNLNGYLYYSQNQAKTPNYRFDTTNWVGTPRYSVTPSLPAGLTLNNSTGEITGAPTVAQPATIYTIFVEGNYNYQSNGQPVIANKNFCIGWEFELTVWASGGNNNNNQQQPSYTPFTVSQSSFTPASSGLSSLPVGSPLPAFTASFSGYSSNAEFNMINLGVGAPESGIFYSLQGAVENNENSYVTWDPNSNNCSITSLSIGGVAQSAASGVTCLKSTYAGSTPAQYWISIKFPNRVNSAVNLTVAPNTFTVTESGNKNFFAVLITRNSSPDYRSIVSQAFDQSPTPSAPTVALDFSLTVGQQVANASVPYSASGLQVGSNYDITVRSTPQIIAQGTVPAGGTVSGSATIPAGLAPGWHTITFTTTAADGAETKDVVWFKIAGDGTLLATSDVQPAELALTPAPQPGSWYFAFLILLMGIGVFFVAREINPEFMRVMTIAKNENGEWEFTKRRIRSEEY
jgi:hypothetical protein